MLQALAEVAPIVAAGGVVGVLAARAGVTAFIPLAPSVLPRVESIEINAAVLLFSVGMLAMTALIAGLLPAMQAWGSDSLTATREEGRSVAGGRQQAGRRTIVVVSQIALVMPLLVGAGLLVRSFTALTDVDPGFRTANVQTLQLAIPRSRYPDDADVIAFCTRLVERVSGVPGVASVGMVNRLPLAGVGQVNLLEFDTAAPIKPMISGDTRSVTPDYFRTMGIPLVEGRLFTDHDLATIPTARLGPMPSAAIVDEQIARTVWPAESALGKRFRFAFDGASWIEIVGVVGHIRHDGLDVDPRRQVYFSHAQRAQDRMAMVVRGNQDVRGLRAAILHAIREVDPEQPVYDVKTLDEVLNQSIVRRWLNMILVTAFAIIALALASIGVYGVMAYGVTTQRREFGIRLALGARSVDITRLVLRRGALLVAAGISIGVMGSVALAQTMRSLLFGVQPGDVTTFAGAAMLVVTVALIATYVPARRAASVNPAITLRAE